MDTDDIGDQIDKEVGAELLFHREKQELSRAQLHRRSGVAAKTIQRFEEGKRSPNVQQLYALCRALGLPVRDFIARALKDVDGA